MTAARGYAAGALVLLLSLSLMMTGARAFEQKPPPYRVIAVSSPFSGHANPLLAICHGLLARGHNVTFASAGSTFSVSAALLRHPNFTYVNVPLSKQYEEELAVLGRPSGNFMELHARIKKVFFSMHRAISVGLLDGSSNATLKRGDYDAVLGSAISAAAFDVAEALSPIEGERLPIAVQSLLIAAVFGEQLRLPFGPWFPSLPFPKSGYGWFVDELIQTISNVFIRSLMPYELRKSIESIRSEIRATTGINISLTGDYARHQLPLVLVSRPRPLDTVWDLDPPHVHRVGVLTPPPETLPAALLQWLADSDEVLYVSLGTVVAPTTDEVALLANAFNAFVRERSDIKRRVLWSLKQKFQSMVDKSLFPENAMRIEAWVPQRDVLEHEKVKAFFTHGGYNSISESVLFGKPMIGVPFFGDQPLNVETVVELDLAVSLDASVLSNLKNGTEQVYDALIKVWNDPGYLQRATKMAAIVGPPDIAVQRSAELIEYIVRVNGAMDLFEMRPTSTWSSALLRTAIMLGALGILFALLYAIFKLCVLVFRKLSRCRKSASKSKTE